MKKRTKFLKLEKKRKAEEKILNFIERAKPEIVGLFQKSWVCCSRW